MPLAAEDFLQENSGVAAVLSGATSFPVSLPAGTTAGTTVLVFLSSTTAISGITGFIADKAVTNRLYVLRGSELAAGASSWTVNFTTSAASNVSIPWYVVELANIDLIEPLDSWALTGADNVRANGATLSTGTAPLNAGLDTVVFAAFEASQSAGSDVQSWGGYTNDFEEVVDIAANVSGSLQLAVARKFVSGVTGQFETTATFATTAADAPTAALLVAYRMAGAKIVAPLAFLAGYEWGANSGMDSHNGVDAMMANPIGHGGTWNTNRLIQAASARNGSYGLRVVQTGAAAFVRTGDLGSSKRAGAVGFNVRVVSATGTVIVAELVTGGAGTAAQLLYDATNSKFGVRAGTTGTAQWQSGTTATNTWVWVDIRCKVSKDPHEVDWRIETGTDTYTAQTSATRSAAADTIRSMALGGNAAQTMTADYDDLVMSAHYTAYPLGPHQVRLLTVDTGGTPSVSGTTTNFNVFTANGTLAAWNATNAGNAVDEVPPTISSSADGVVQVNAATSDYMAFPMAASTVADNEIVAGVRMVACCWGGTGAGTGTLGFRGWDGSAETTLIGAAFSYDATSPTAAAATLPHWQCALWSQASGWTKTKLDAADLRVGFSTDATPDMGVSALYLEYATRKAEPLLLFGDAGAVPRVEQDTNPNTLGIRSLRTYTGADQSLEVTYETSGTPTTYTAPANSNPHTQSIDAPDMPTVNWLTARLA